MSLLAQSVVTLLRSNSGRFLIDRTSAGLTSTQPSVAQINRLADELKFGPKFKLTSINARKPQSGAAGVEALTEIARTFGVSHSNISRHYEASFLRIALDK
jgi:hypothetical protein